MIKKKFNEKSHEIKLTWRERAKKVWLSEHKIITTTKSHTIFKGLTQKDEFLSGLASAW